MWASEAAIRNVLRDALRGVELDGFENDCAAAAWNNIAEEQTFRLIRHQCGAIWNIVKGDLAELKVCPAARTERIKELTRVSLSYEGRLFQLSVVGEANDLYILIDQRRANRTSHSGVLRRNGKEDQGAPDRAWTAN